MPAGTTIAASTLAALNSTDLNQDVIVYNPTLIVDTNGNEVKDVSIAFLLRALLNEMHALRELIEGNETDL